MRSRFSRTAVTVFELFFRVWMRSRVEAVRVTGLTAAIPDAGPLLLAANHVSWWDGFVLREMQRMLRPRAPLYFVMSRQELDRFPFFRFMGGFGIEEGSPGSIARTLRQLDTRLRQRPDSVVLFFPQGRIWPSHRRPLGFRRGVETFAERLGTTVLPVAIHPEPLNAVSPTFFVSVGEPARRITAGELERRVRRELDAILDFLAEHGEGAARAWPPPDGRLTASEPLPQRVM